MILKLILTYILSFLTIICFAGLNTARIFSNNMVLQREAIITVWGTADPEDVIIVTLGISSAKTITDSNGNWEIGLPKMSAGGPLQMVVKSKSDSIVFENVFIGDVWYASGQSNMEHPVQGWEFIPHSGVNHFEEEISDSNYPKIRLFNVPKYPAPIVQRELHGGQWEIAGPQSVAGFSSVAWFFAKELYQKLKVPIGIINSSWGGTPIQTWMSREMLENLNDSLNLPAVPVCFDVEEWNKKVAESVEKNRIRRNQISYPPDDLPAKISAQDFADSSWKEINILDEDSSFSSVVWLRRTINNLEPDKDKPLILSLGFLNRQSNVYWNGNELGYCQYPKPVKYVIPPNLVHSGENILTIRMAQPWGNTQVLGEPEQFYIAAKDSSFNLSLVQDWKSCDNLEIIAPATESYQNSPTFLFNGMVAPVIPYGIKGFIWYQGESDANHPFLYEKMFHGLITGWRKRWGRGNLPFLFVQLSSTELTHHIGSRSWCWLREVQRRALQLKQTGMVISIDIGDTYDVHPKNKKEIGHRLVLKALNVAYGKNVNSCGPNPIVIKLKGDTIVMKFSDRICTKGAKDGDIEVASFDGVFKKALFHIKSKKLFVYSPKVEKPSLIRYAWKNDPDCFLFNKSGLPAGPFIFDLNQILKTLHYENTNLLYCDTNISKILPKYTEKNRKYQMAF